jgi:hypothetical protein
MFAGAMPGCSQQGGGRMTQPFLGQIQPFGFNFAPLGWAQCNGQILNILQTRLKVA